MSPSGSSYIALDAVVCDRVLLVTDGHAAMTAVNRPQSPIDAAILAIIGHVELDVPSSPR